MAGSRSGVGLGGVVLVRGTGYEQRPFHDGSDRSAHAVAATPVGARGRHIRQAMTFHLGGNAASTLR